MSLSYDKEKKTILESESKLHHTESQRFDEVRIKTIPRWKESELSGDEWRFHAQVEFLYKGDVIWSHGFCDCETAMQMALTMFTLDCEMAKVQKPEKNVCQQEGCNNPATKKAYFKKRYCVGGGNCGQEKKMYGKDYYVFCDRHIHRGDCDIEDCDSNFEVVSL
ncbi:MAG: hypothetical protein [Siphoviridae sp. ctCJE6]|nr:MAG: hypothetical protein [Siphoviridae sp. ctCJE6]